MIPWFVATLTLEVSVGAHGQHLARWLIEHPLLTLLVVGPRQERTSQIELLSNLVEIAEEEVYPPSA